MQKMASGFEVAVHQCEMCGETAEGIPDGHWPRGLPKGWIAVVLKFYTPDATGKGMTWACPKRTYFYCSESHLPSEFLPPDEPGG